jgi:tripartite-type tricarboxylate transporter receptor subunit TctC
MLPRRRFLHLTAGAAVSPFLPQFAEAQTYSSRPSQIGVGLPASLAMQQSVDASHPTTTRDAEAFYKSHDKITLSAPSSAGGGYDTYTRLLARHIAKFIPGAPTIIVEDIPAGGGMTIANMIYNTAPKDGTFIGLVRGPVIQEGILGNREVFFDARKFAWIGNMDASFHETCIVWAATGIKSMSDAYSRQIIVGSSGSGANSSLFPTVYNQLLGTKFKIIPGYPGTPQRLLAMERGELDGACGISTSDIRSFLDQAYRQRKILLLVQAGVEKDPAFPDIPNILDEAKTPEVREALLFLLEGLELGRAFACAPETPADRVALLRGAFDKAMNDPDLIEEAQKMRLDIAAATGGTCAAVVDRLYQTPTSALDRLRSALTNAAK